MKATKEQAPFIVVSGPSGSGKTSLCRRIAQDLGWYYSISHTTRPQKVSEENGRDYFFVSPEEFLRLKDDGEFLEWAQVYDNYYGTSRKIIKSKLSAGQGVILDVDTQGADQIKKAMPQSVLIFIKTQSIDDLRERLTSRARDSKSEIKKRIDRAENEMSHMQVYDYIVVNDDLERAVNEVKAIISQK